MKIRLNTAIAGPGLVLGVGDTADFPEDEAKRLIDKVFAEPVRAAKKAPEKKIETAAFPTEEIETATE